MRVALCFSGQPRYLMQTYPYWRNCIIDRYSADVFVHTWKTPLDPAHNQWVSDTVVSLYNPVSFQFETPVEFDVSSYTDRIWPFRITPSAQFSQFTGVQRSQQLRHRHEAAQGFVYDVVVRARFDWYLKRVDFEKNNCVNTARTPTLDGHRFLWRDQQLVGISDQFAYGSSEIMTTYGDMVDNIYNLYHNERVDFCGELFLRAHLAYHNLPIKEHHFDNGIVRDWGVMP